MSWNVVPEFIAAGGLLFIILSITRVYKLGKMNNSGLVGACAAAIVSALTNALTALCISGDVNLPLFLEHVANYVFYMGTPFAVVFLVSYLIQVMETEIHKPIMVKVFRISSVLCLGLVFGLMVANIFSPVVYAITDAGYYRGPAHPWLTYIGLIYTAGISIPILIVWRKVSKLIMTPVLIMLFVGLALMIIQILLPYILLQGTVFFACIIILCVAMLKRNMSYDQLSGCYNRNSYNLEMESPRFRRSIKYIALISLVNYKDVDDEFGWEIGDSMIGIISDFLISVAGHDNVFHITSTQFVCVFTQADSLPLIRRIAERFTRDWSLDETYCHITAAVSCYDCREGGMPEDVLSCLDFSIDKSDVVYGEPIICGGEQYEAMNEEKRLVRVIKDALKQNRIEWRYHPICNITNEAWNMVGVECVPYVRDDVKGLLPPQEFLRVSNYSNLIEEDINYSALKHICKLQEKLTDVGADYLWVSCGLTKSQIASQTMFNQLITIIASSNAISSNIRLKVVYSSDGRDLDEYEEGIVKLEQLGVGVIAADSGATRITDLLYTPASTVELADRFIDRADDGRDARFNDLVVKELRSAGKNVIVAGVTSGKRLATARSYGARYGMGRYLSRARTEEELINTVARDRASVCQMIWEDMKATDY